MAELQIPDVGGNALAAFYDGQQRGKQSKLASLLGTAVSDPSQRQGAINQAAMIDPQAAMSARKSLNEESLSDLARDASMFVSMAQSGDQATLGQAYQQIAQKAQQVFGHPFPTSYDPKYLPMIQKLAGAQAAEGYTLSPGSRRYGPDGQLVAEAPFAPANASVVAVPDGQGGTVQMLFDPKTRQLSEPQYPGAPQGQPQAMPTGGASTMLDSSFKGAMDPQAIQSDFRTLAQGFPGVQISSLSRTPEHNKAVGGVANSQHIAGTAGDFVVPREQQPAFIAAAKAHGYEAINEGDHIHLELPPGRRAPQQVAQAGRMGYTPPKSASKDAPAGFQWNADHTALSAIPGGPAEISIAARKDAAAAKDAAVAAKAQVATARQAEASGAATQLVDAIDGLMASPGFAHLGTVRGDLEVNVPMIRNATKDADAQLKNIAGQVALTTMARLKALSAQGATGFGALSAPELKLLQNSISTLQSDQISNAQLVTSLANIKRLMQKTATWQGGQQPSQDQPPASGWSIQAVP